MFFLHISKAISSVRNIITLQLKLLINASKLHRVMKMLEIRNLSIGGNSLEENCKHKSFDLSGSWRRKL